MDRLNSDIKEFLDSSNIKDSIDAFNVLIAGYNLIERWNNDWQELAIDASIRDGDFELYEEYLVVAEKFRERATINFLKAFYEKLSSNNSFLGL